MAAANRSLRLQEYRIVTLSFGWQRDTGLIEERKRGGFAERTSVGLFRKCARPAVRRNATADLHVWSSDRGDRPADRPSR